MVGETVSANDSLHLNTANLLSSPSPNGLAKLSSNVATVAGYVAVAKPFAIDAGGQFQAAEHVVAPGLEKYNVAGQSTGDPRIGTIVGNFYIEGVIASGGMGTVYLAQQREPVRRTVALKMIRRGMTDESTLGRFLAERQALAVMDHPDIAQVFEADTADDGNPYFAMEFCTGEPIDRYCRTNQLDLAERLKLVIRIARAVQQAHSRGVIHRDLKPANILVSPCEGGLSLKIIDFGIAKFTDGQWQGGDREATRIGELVGTPAYMSPEQATGIEIDARCDVFAIGAILFKLLTDTTPQRVNDQDAACNPPLSVIFEQLKSFVPVTPSYRFSTLANDKQRQLAEDTGAATPKKLKHSIRGDLDWITLRAIDSDRTRRYATANDLADDLQRFLHNEPVNAVAPSRAYRAKKFYQRNRIPVLAMAAIATVILISSTIAAIGWWNYESERIEEQRRVAEEADILLNDAQASRRLAAKGGPEAEACFIAAESSLAKAESILTGPHGLPHLSSLLFESRLAIAADRAALRLVQRIENARQRACLLTTIDDSSTFGRDIAIAEISDAMEDFGIRVGITHPDDAATLLSQCPSAMHSQLVEALHFLLAQNATDSGQDLNPSSDTQSILPNGLIAHWANETASIIDPDEWRTRVRGCIINADAQSLLELAKLPVPDDQPVDGYLVLVEGLTALDRSSESIGILRLIQLRHPDNYWVNHHLGIVLADSGERHLSEESLRYLTTAVSLRPDSLGARVNLAEVLVRSGDHMGAANHLRMATALAPTNHAIQWRLKSLLATKDELLHHSKESLEH